MNTYAFDLIKGEDKIKERIDLIYIGEDTAYATEIGNIYNLYDYIINHSFDNDKVIFCNFTANALEDITNHISKYKKINKVINYNSLIISDKKKTRSLSNAKLD